MEGGEEGILNPIAGKHVPAVVAFGFAFSEVESSAADGRAAARWQHARDSVKNAETAGAKSIVSNLRTLRRVHSAKNQPIVFKLRELYLCTWAHKQNSVTVLKI